MKSFRQITKITFIYLIIIIFCISCITIDGRETKPNKRIVKLTVKSRALGKDMKLWVYVPEGYSRQNKYPVLYLLHGYSHTVEKWLYDIEVHFTANKLTKEGKIMPLLIVTPQYDNSFGFNSSKKTSVMGGANPDKNFNLGRYEDWLIKEMIPYVDRNFSTVKNRDSRFIGGQSMGGYAALRLAFKHPDLFSKVGGHMPVVKFKLPSSFYSYITGPVEEFEKKIGSPIDLAETANISNLSVYLDAGEQDEFKTNEGSEKLFEILQRRNIVSEYHLNKGDHSSMYVKTQVEKYLLFYAGIKKVQ